MKEIHSQTNDGSGLFGFTYERKGTLHTPFLKSYKVKKDTCFFIQ